MIAREGTLLGTWKKSMLTSQCEMNIINSDVVAGSGANGLVSGKKQCYSQVIPSKKSSKAFGKASAIFGSPSVIFGSLCKATDHVR